jgi:hypothetical protein
MHVGRSSIISSSSVSAARLKKAGAKHAIHRNLKSTFGFLAVKKAGVALLL